MSITDNQPTKIGQRVQEIYTDSRGWVIELGEQDGDKVAVVDWDVKSSIDEEDRIFPIEALRVVEVIRLDADHYEDPSTHPVVESTYTGTEHGTVYKLKTGTVVKGVDQMRLYLIGYSESA